MKFGLRTPSIKKSVKARTIGKVKRQVKKAVNPLYGKKGMGLVNDPKKAAYNAVYSRTTVGMSNVIKGATAASGQASVPPSPAPVKIEYSDQTYKVFGIALIVIGVILVLLGLLLLIASPIYGAIAVLGGVLAFVIGRKYRKIVKERSTNKN